MEYDRKRFQELDALRGLAAVAVLIFHYTSHYETQFEYVGRPFASLPYGYLGVQLFFMISGFVIFMTLCKVSRPLDFVVSRFSRLYPAYWTCVLLTSGIILLMGLPGKEPTTLQVLVNMTMLQQLLFFKDVDGVYWTLLVEMIFYVSMFVLLVTSQLHRILSILLVWLAIAAMQIGIERFTTLRIPYTAEMFLNLKYIPHFALGIAFYQYRKTSSHTPASLLVIISSVSVVAFSGDLVATFACLAFILLFQLFLHEKLRFLATKPLLFLGTISYPLYLLHENIGFVVIRQFTAYGLNINICIAIATLTSLVLAALVTRYVEVPAMRYIRQQYRARPAA